MRWPAAWGSAIPRLLIGLAGLALIGVGLIEMLVFDLVDLGWLVGWLAAGVILHDLVLAPASTVVAKLALRRWTVKERRITVVTSVCIGSLTLIALPLLGRQGAVADNPTLLGRNYLGGWAAACLLILLGALIAEVVRRVRANRDRRDDRNRETLSRGGQA